MKEKRIFELSPIEKSWCDETMPSAPYWIFRSSRQTSQKIYVGNGHRGSFKRIYFLMFSTHFQTPMGAQRGPLLLKQIISTP